MCPSPIAAAKKLRQPLEFETQLRGHSLTFQSTWGIFSPREVDEGSRMLLDLIDLAPNAKVLDLGCGYGVLGITLAKMAPEGEVLMLDKDVTAVDYAKKNIALNKLQNAQAELSNGFQAIADNQRFDLIVSNIPAKVGNEMLYLFLYDALHHLNPGGEFWVVTITGLRKFMQRTFNEVFGNYDKVKQGKAYTVARTVKS